MERSRPALNILVVLVLLLAWPTAACADIVAEVAGYFKPASGALVAIDAENYLVNLDASAGLMAGDLLSIVTPGKELLDPASGAVLGALDSVKGVLKVTRIRSGFSQARPVGEVVRAEPGDLVRRFQNLRAIFADQRGTGQQLYAQLVAALPALEWQGYYQLATPAEQSAGQQQPAELVFLLTDTALSVHDGTGQLLRSFPLGEQPPPTAQRPASAAPLAGLPAAPQPSSAPVARDRSSQASQAQAQVEYAAEYPGYQTLGEFPNMVLMADFATLDEQLLVAATDGQGLKLFAVAQGMQLLAEEDFPPQTKIHAVAWWRPEAGQPPYLAITASKTKSFSFSTSAETVFTSSLYRYRDGQLTPVRHNLPYLLGSFDRNADGAKETLLGQRFDLDITFGAIYRLTLQEDDLRENRPDFELPLGFPVQGSLLADLTGDGKPETVYTRKGILYIISEGKLRYESAKQMGGSLSRLTYDLNPGQADALFSTVAFEVPQVAADLDGDGQLELIAVSAEHSGVSVPGLDFGGGESWLTVIKYQNGRFVKGVLGDKLEKPVQGLAISPGQALVVLSRRDSILDGQGQSHLLSLPLGR